MQILPSCNPKDETTLLGPLSPPSFADKGSNSLGATALVVLVIGAVAEPIRHKNYQIISFIE